MSRRGILKWVTLAMVGLFIAAGVAFAGSRLVSRQIGLASEPIRAGDALAPRNPSHARTHKRADAKPSNPREPARPVEPVAPETPIEDRLDGDGDDD
jgi:hypothetical protein